MDSSSEDDDSQRQKFLEAADPTFFTNAMFQTPPQQKQQPAENLEELVPAITPSEKSQRYLVEEEAYYGSVDDIHLPETVRDHMYKKLQKVIEQRNVFETINIDVTKEKPFKSKLKLVMDAECYLKTDDELGDVGVKGPQIKPVIKRRTIPEEGDGVELSETMKLQAAVVSIADICEEVKHWAAKRERPHKMFKYKAGGKGYASCCRN